MEASVGMDEGPWKLISSFVYQNPQEMGADLSPWFSMMSRARGFGGS
jgi:hypothetical protein